MNTYSYSCPVRGATLLTVRPKYFSNVIVFCFCFHFLLLFYDCSYIILAFLTFDVHDRFPCKLAAKDEIIVRCSQCRVDSFMDEALTVFVEVVAIEPVVATFVGRVLILLASRTFRVRAR